MGVDIGTILTNYRPDMTREELDSSGNNLREIRAPLTEAGSELLLNGPTQGGLPDLGHLPFDGQSSIRRKGFAFTLEA